MIAAIMKLRKSIALKLFAILLFSLEMLAPAFVEAQVLEDTALEIESLATPHTQSLLFTFLGSEVNESEESREGQQSVIDLPASSIMAGLLRRVGSVHFRFAFASKSQQFDTRPSLFTLNCVYVI